MIIDNEDMKKLILGDKLFKELFKIKSVETYFFKKLKDFANTNSIENMKKFDIDSCLSCKRTWFESEKVKPHDAHNFSRALILSPLSNNKKIFIANKTRPFTVIDEDQEILEKIKFEDFFEKIKSATTFGGICYECDQVYNTLFEKGGNLDFNNEEHLKLFVERSSLFKYYRELLITKIMSKLLNLPINDIGRQNWKEYKKIKEEIYKLEITKMRDSIFEKNRVLFRKDDLTITHKVYSFDKIKNVMFTDYYEPLSKNIALINLIVLRGQTFLIISSKSKEPDLFNTIHSSLPEKINNLDFKDMILIDPFCYENLDLNRIKIDVNILNGYLYVIVNEKMYTSIHLEKIGDVILKEHVEFCKYTDYKNKRITICPECDKNKGVSFNFTYLLKDRIFKELTFESLNSIYGKK